MPKLIKFSQPTCNDCKRVDIMLQGNDVQADEIYDPFENPELAGKYDIGSIPVTILLADDGKEIIRAIGYDIPKLNEIIEQL